MSIIKKAIFIVLVASLFVLFGSAAAETIETDGEVISVDIATGKVSVLCDNGDVVSYFADGVVYCGRVHLLIIEGEVKDAISYTELNNILSHVTK